MVGPTLYMLMCNLAILHVQTTIFRQQLADLEAQGLPPDRRLEDFEDYHEYICRLIGLPVSAAQLTLWAKLSARRVKQSKKRKSEAAKRKRTEGKKNLTAARQAERKANQPRYKPDEGDSEVEDEGDEPKPKRERRTKGDAGTCGCSGACIRGCACASEKKDCLPAPPGQVLLADAQRFSWCVRRGWLIGRGWLVECGCLIRICTTPAGVCLVVRATA